MSKAKQFDVKKALSELTDKKIPEIMDAVMANTDMSTDDRVRIVGMLGTALYHVKLAQAGIE